MIDKDGNAKKKDHPVTRGGLGRKNRGGGKPGKASERTRGGHFLIFGRNSSPDTKERRGELRE